MDRTASATGIARSYRTVFDIAGIPAFAQFYDTGIFVWKMLYRGYYKPWHLVHAPTVASPQATRDLYRLNTAKAVCAELAGLVWGEECEIDVTEAQVQWFAELLLRTPRDWGIIVCGHIPITPHLRWSHPRVTLFSELIEAYNRRERVSLQAPSYRDGTFPVQADFTAAEGRVLMSICGHGHVDDLYVSPTDCIYVETHCESVHNNNGGSPHPREAGTVTETVLDVCILECDTGRLHLVRYGAGEDRNA
jgi:hypothetical protein